MSSRRSEDSERDRWQQLLAVAHTLATRRGCRAQVVRFPQRWLEQGHDQRLGREEIVVTWTHADAEVLRHALRGRLDGGRVFAAAPRVRRGGRRPAPWMRHRSTESSRARAEET